MKTFRLGAVSFIFAAIFAVSAFAQTQPAAGKIGLVNTYEFGGDEKGAGGITKVKNAMKSVDDEFKLVNDKLKTMGTKYQTLAQEIETLRKNASNPAVPVGPDVRKNLENKAEELQALETQIKREQEDAKAKYERRYQQVMGPVLDDVRKAMNEFAKKNGYAVIFDGAKLEQADVLWGFDEKYNVTPEFITYYNARPAGAATATATKP